MPVNVTLNGVEQYDNNLIDNTPLVSSPSG